WARCASGACSSARASATTPSPSPRPDGCPPCWRRRSAPGCASCSPSGAPPVPGRRPSPSPPSSPASGPPCSCRGACGGARGGPSASAGRPRPPRPSSSPTRPDRPTPDQGGTAMRTPICDQLGIEFPIFAFSHCRDVVAAVSKAGGIGVLGASGFSPEQLEIELAWLDEHVGDTPYGVDIVIPSKYEGMDLDHLTPEELEAEMAKHIPDEHVAFGKKLLADHGVPELPEEERHHRLLGWTSVTAAPQIEVILRHDKARLVANAL